MNIDEIKSYLEKPEPFTPGEPLFWDDPHISGQMLKWHINSENDVASRRPETIEASVAWMIKELNLKPDDFILDLGCGPGLYSSRLAQYGLKVTGVDYSRSSIAYAQDFAQKNDLEIDYRYQNYLELEDENCFDAVLLIYGDFCPLSPQQRSQLLSNVHRALKPGGHFVLDVTTRQHRQKYGNQNKWYMVESGFWKPGPHLVLEEGYDYPEQSIFLDQVIVIEENGKISVYRNWFQDYTSESIIQELNDGGFTIESIWGNLTGAPYKENTEWIGLIAQKKSG